MIQNTNVERISEDGFSRTTWGFRFDSFWHRLELDEYFVQTRLTTRHKWRTLLYYYRLGHRRSISAEGRFVERVDVSIPADVAAEARKTFLGTILVHVDGEPKPKE